jgi:cysteine desulfurase
VVFVDPETDGRVSAEKVKRALDDRTALVSVMHGNNEIGAINPVRDIGAAVRAFRGDRMYPLFHADAAQSFPYIPVALPGLQADAITISSHKMYGPKGAAALAVTRETIDGKIIAPMLFGGEQEFGFRPGTVNIPAIVGFEEAMRETERIREKRTKAIGTVKEAFWKKLKQAVKKAELNGVLEKPSALPKGYLPHIVSFRVPGVSAEQLVIGLDRAGIAVSSGSACTARHASYSRTVRVVWGEERARGSVRVSFAEATRSADILRTVREISKIARK